MNVIQNYVLAVHSVVINDFNVKKEKRGFQYFKQIVEDGDFVHLLISNEEIWSLNIGEKLYLMNYVRKECVPLMLMKRTFISWITVMEKSLMLVQKGLKLDLLIIVVNQIVILRNGNYYAFEKGIMREREKKKKTNDLK
jgi:hypothetical protein